jgi:hypothetical protein
MFRPTPSGETKTWRGWALTGSISSLVDLGLVDPGLVGSAILFTGIQVFSPIRFLWNATRGSRLTPWRSKYLRWRLETYSGMWAEKMKVGEIFSFVWAQRWEFLSFLLWTGRVQREARRRP